MSWTKKTVFSIISILATVWIMGVSPLSAKPKVAAIYTLPVEQQWISRIHKALNTSKARGDIEYVFSESDKINLFTPFIGFTGTAEGGTYGYAGIGVDLFFDDKLVLTPNFAAGAYGNGAGKDLGYAVEFRSGFNFMFRLDDNSRVGFSFHHISNAGLDDRNPGEESLLVIYSVPFNRLFAR